MTIAGRDSAGPQPQERIHLYQSEGGELNGELENETEKNTTEVQLCSTWTPCKTSKRQERPLPAWKLNQLCGELG